MSAYHFKYFQNIQFKNHGIAQTPPYLPTLKAYPTPGVGGRFEIFSLKWRERMNLKVPGAILPLGCAILSTRAITVRGGWYNPPPLGELGLRQCRLLSCLNYFQNFFQTGQICLQISIKIVLNHPVYRGANINSDHNPAVTSVRLSLAASMQQKKQSKYDLQNC